MADADTASPWVWWTRPALVVGFLSVTVAVILSYTHPATGYELSLYGATPVGFWIAITIALAIALVITITAPLAWTRNLALALASCALLSIFGLPLMRGYYFYGSADPLTHLGLTKDLATGAMSPFGMIYPAIHIITVFVERLTGLPYRNGLLLLTILFALLYIVFVPYCARLLATGPLTMGIGLFSAALMLPINHVSTHFRVHPFTLTTLYSAFIIFLLLKTVLSLGQTDGPDTDTTHAHTGSLLALTIVLSAVVVYHPQQALNLLIFFVILCGVQFFYGIGKPAHPVANQPRLYAPTVFFAGVYSIWTVRTTWFYRLASKHIEKVVGYINGETVAGERVQAQGASIAAVGGSIPELFVKLFLLSTVFASITGLVALVSIRNALDDDPTISASTRLYLTLSLVPLLGLFVIYMVGSISKMQFRHLGFMMVAATMLGTVGISAGLSRIRDRFSKRTGSVVLVAVFGLMLVLAIAPLYQSPYIYKQNVQISEAQLTGYDQTFEGLPPERHILGIRMQPTRYADGTHGVRWTDARQDQYQQTLSFHGLGRLRTSMPRSQYLAVGTIDRQREVVAYNELRFSEESFDSVPYQPGVNRVLSNGELSVYFVHAHNRPGVGPANESSIGVSAR